MDLKKKTILVTLFFLNQALNLLLLAGFSLVTLVNDEAVVVVVVLVANETGLVVAVSGMPNLGGFEKIDLFGDVVVVGDGFVFVACDVGTAADVEN